MQKQKSSPRNQAFPKQQTLCSTKLYTNVNKVVSRSEEYQNEQVVDEPKNEEGGGTVGGQIKWCTVRCTHYCCTVWQHCHEDYGFQIKNINRSASEQLFITILLIIICHNTCKFYATSSATSNFTTVLHTYNPHPTAPHTHKTVLFTLPPSAHTQQSRTLFSYCNNRSLPQSYYLAFLVALSLQSLATTLNAVSSYSVGVNSLISRTTFFPAKNGLSSA